MNEIERFLRALNLNVPLTRFFKILNRLYLGILRSLRILLNNIINTTTRP